MANFCSNCGTKLDPNAKFCPECGNPVATTVTPAPTVTPAATEPAKVTVTTAGIEELQSELYSLYKMLEPARELDGARRKVAAKLAEVRGYQAKVNEQFYRDCVYYAPFVGPGSVNKLDESIVTPTTKEETKAWETYVKRYSKKFSEFEPFDEGKYLLLDIFHLMKRNEAKILRNFPMSWHYYKMCYVFEEPKSPEKYWAGYVCDENEKHENNNYSLINYQNFIHNYLPQKLGRNYEEYLMEMPKYSYFYKGEYQLNDITNGYFSVPSIERTNLRMYDTSLGFPQMQFTYRGKRPIAMYKIGEEVQARLKKDVPVKKECDGVFWELSRLKDKMDATFNSYMSDVDAYINAHIKIVPMSYARNWDTVAYFLYLIVNRRGRDIYEVINQYEIDMKHRELTSALVDIRSEIGNQTQVLGGKLDKVNRSVVQMSDKITLTLCAQTAILGQQLEKINDSIIYSGAAVVGAIAGMGANMANAMSNMHVKVSV